ncbi:hypothetical protein [Streptantibioticus ferralitis]|uniref:Uncharacterized protein n=1 Tax=Streptantibioticus ferralitis TaxID=236510 RepID=A0ABT5Z9F1_9ACTN|nr:hypothetical protein [Streptantibioticus ferralitis]MDF2260453.1 hypothetical protein [Streptantibioticus ferralitis]
MLDHGLGTRTTRDDYKRLVTQHGATWMLVHCEVTHEDLLRRLAQRSAGPEFEVISPEPLAWLAEHSKPPAGEGEEPPVLPR